MNKWKFVLCCVVFCWKVMKTKKKGLKQSEANWRETIIRLDFMRENIDAILALSCKVTLNDTNRQKEFALFLGEIL